MRLGCYIALFEGHKIFDTSLLFSMGEAFLGNDFKGKKGKNKERKDEKRKKYYLKGT